MASLSRLCDLITASLQPYIESKPCRLTKETEKDLLLSLSSISREIQRWASDSNCESEEDIGASSHFGHDCCHHLDLPSTGGCLCLATIVATMVSFLSVENRFVEHVAGNILVSMSSFLMKYRSKWAVFIQLLCIGLEAVVSSIHSSTSQSSTVKSIDPLAENMMYHYHALITNEGFGTKDLGFDFTKLYIALLQSRLVNVNWVMVASLFRILRSILKSVKQDNGFLEGVFVKLVVSFLITMPLELLSEIPVSQTSSGRDDQLDKRNGFNGVNNVLLGTVVQLLCSLVERSDPEDVGNGPWTELDIDSIFTNLTPQLLSCCFSKSVGDKDKGLSQYLSYKMLILMNRLSFHNHWQDSQSLLCLQLLGQYFGDHLYKSMPECDDDSENCLEGSPFLASVSDGDMCTRHLQRQAIFLHFRCCFTLVSRQESGQGCGCVKKALSFAYKLQFCSENCSLMGLSGLSEWLQRCGFLQKSMECENYSELSSSFALSFLQLYMEEDDMLFEMLLLLLDAPFSVLQINNNANGKFLGIVERDATHHISRIFSPIHLFHLFLLLLHYDHLVLIDYLISKDTGVHCAQYLLRCLRMISKSWSVFVDFSMSGSKGSQPCRKRRKVSVNVDCNGKLGPSASSSSVVEGQNMRRQKFGSTHNSIHIQGFGNAKRCLLSLKRSVADLHQKSLFPYNPSPLLRSLTRFEELCAQ